MFANGPGDLGSIPGRVIPKTQKMVLDASLLNTQHYKVRIKGKVEQSREGVAPSPTPWCSSYRKGSLRVTLDYGRQLYFFYLLKPVAKPKRKDSICQTIYLNSKGRYRFMLFLYASAWRGTQTALPRTWTLIFVSISYDGNHYASRESARYNPRKSWLSFADELHVLLLVYL